jgi:hypothetical protein
MITSAHIIKTCMLFVILIFLLIITVAFGTLHTIIVMDRSYNLSTGCHLSKSCEHKNICNYSSFSSIMSGCMLYGILYTIVFSIIFSLCYIMTFHRSDNTLNNTEYNIDSSEIITTESELTL